VRSRTRLVLAALALGAAAVWAVACATQEPPAFSDGTCVAGGCVQSGTSAGASSSSGTCAVETGCAVTWGADIFAGIIDGTAGCTATGLCHGSAMGGLSLTSGDAHDAYVALTGYALSNPAQKYIIPCDPQGSGFTCNMALAADAGANPYGSCSIAMPFGTTAEPLSAAELTSIANWIQCGAPEN
jgi:hypothetical protein